MTDAVTVSALGRTFTGPGGQSYVALADVDLTVERGETHGLLGPNGAGKTTLVRVLSTVLLPSSGSARVLGHDVVREAKAVRRQIGIVFGGDRGLYGRVSARDNLLFWASLFGLGPRAAKRRASELLEELGLAERANQPVEQYSRGMKQRLHLARGLIGDPQVLFLDEPTVGMDPVAALEFRRIIRDLRATGRTIFLTTHDMAEAEAVCDRISLIDGGRLLLTERTERVGDLLAVGDRIDFTWTDPALIDELRVRADVATVTGHGDLPGRWRLVPADGSSVRDLMKVLLDGGVTTIEAAPPRLEEVYLTLVGSRGLEV
ncbi:ABC transporter ATP-binding protein [Rugosimonospora africana]|uniref:Daunorubicin resistance protein DrrA family ABC transporter ATP-binding protein n=1 Tax=Rugosimonospora africana TaxID=556532 RepID=A0A8J3R3W7_9ACTN|nr:ABC transporter ATP-binding protein [Rugosimonospora africana]GIH19626.1 daunorubicin resistance protein DrrA family ABC transporter ATP-binding protein [Rugosimonospora africana]